MDNIKLQSSHGEVSTAKIVRMDDIECIDLETGKDVTDPDAVYFDRKQALEMIAEYEKNIKRLKEFVWDYATPKRPPRRGGGWHHDSAHG
jgi:hypothetical protein